METFSLPVKLLGIFWNFGVVGASFALSSELDFIVDGEDVFFFLVDGEAVLVFLVVGDDVLVFLVVGDDVLVFLVVGDDVPVFLVDTEALLVFLVGGENKPSFSLASEFDFIVDRDDVLVFLVGGKVFFVDEGGVVTGLGILVGEGLLSSSRSLR